MSKRIKFCSNGNDEIDGILSIYQTDIAGLLLINTNSQDQHTNFIFESSPFLKPFREINGTYIIDLLYFIYFTVIKTPPKISFNDRINANIINIKFPDEESLEYFINEMKQKFTLKSKDISGYFEIIKYHPNYSNQHINYNKSLSFLHTLVDTNQILNALRLYQGIIGKIPKQRDFLVYDSKSFKKESLYTLKLKSSNRFDVYLNLLNLPNPLKFDDYKNDYMKSRKQWSSYTPSQLKRSPYFRDLISIICSIVKTTKVQEKETSQFSFNILMTIVQTDKRFMKSLHNIYKILKIIFYIMNLVPSDNSAEIESMIINGQYSVDFDTVESIAFWILLKILYRFEIIKLFDGDSEKIFSDVHLFISNEMPFLHKFLSKNYNYEDLSCLESSNFCLFADFFDVDDCVDMWSVALSFPYSNFYFISLIIAVLIYHFDIYEKYQQKNFPNFTSIIKNAIRKLSVDFIITASALVCANRDKLNINVI